IKPQGEIRTYQIACFRHHLDVLLQTGAAITRTVATRNLGALKAPLLRQIGSSCSCINRKLLLRLASDQCTHRLAAHLPKAVPNGQVHGANRLDGETLAAVRHSGAPHLVPDQLDIARILPFDKAVQMLFDDVAGWFSTDAAANAYNSVIELDLHQHRTQSIDAPAGPFWFVLLINGHRIGDRQIDNPVAAVLIVIIRAHLGGCNHIGTDVAYLRNLHGSVPGTFKKGSLWGRSVSKVKFVDVFSIENEWSSQPYLILSDFNFAKAPGV